ncbi:hypothetical protein Trydic_g11185 [Trypoxylus dichotomus]
MVLFNSLHDERTNMYPKQNVKRPCILSCASFLAVAGTILMFFAPWIYNITTNFVLSLTTKPTFDLWRKNPMPLYLEFYIFNWTNPTDIYNPDIKPHFEEIGPFVFEETKEKVNITWNDNNTITFNHLRYWYFDESRSCANLSTKVTTINSVAVFAAAVVEDWIYVLRKGFDISISALSTKVEKVTTVGELLFYGYEDALINLAHKMPQMKALRIPNYDKFGWFYERNGSSLFDGTFNMDISGSSFGNTRQWNYKDYMPYYEGECNKVRGSAGEFYSANRQRDKIGFFSPDICRYVPLDYEQDVNIDGTRGYKYILGDSFLDNGTKVPENKCYCGDYCTPYGALNISACRYNAPGFVSQPHFYGADPYYLDKITGLHPSKDKHEMFMVLEPSTGIPLHVEARLQLNILIKPIRSVSLFEGIPTFHFPVIWFEQKARIPSSLHFLLKILLHMQLILRCIGAIMVIIGIPWLICLLYKPFLKKMHWKSQNQTLSISDASTKDSAKPLMKLKHTKETHLR